MDPITLFAMANAAVSAVKAGCKLYKDIKGAAGEVKEVLKDLDDQFSKLHPPEKPATTEQRNQYIKQKNEVIELNKKAESGQHTGVYQEIGDYLGQYYDNYYKCLAIFEEEERRSNTEVYTGDAGTRSFWAGVHLDFFLSQFILFFEPEYMLTLYIKKLKI